MFKIVNYSANIEFQALVFLQTVLNNTLNVIYYLPYIQVKVVAEYNTKIMRPGKSVILSIKSNCYLVYT